MPGNTFFFFAIMSKRQQQKMLNPKNYLNMDLLF